MSPYERVWQTILLRRWRTEPVVVAAPYVVPVLAAALAAPFVQGTWFRFLADPAGWGAGVEGLLGFVSIPVVGLLALDAHGALIRGEDRRVLDVLPIDPGVLVGHLVRRILIERAFIPIAAAILLWPVLVVAPMLWVLAVLHVAGVATLAAVVASRFVLAAVPIAESPRWAPFLDAIRGQNPRPQAAFLYAPGAVLALVGLVASLSATGVRIAWDGGAAGVMALLPWLLLPLPAWGLRGLARRAWFRAAAVVADVDARWAAVEGPDAARAVYLEGIVRAFPVGVARWLLLDLRHGWRARRAWVQAPWLLAGVAAFVALGHDAGAIGRSAAIAAVGAWAVGGVGPRLDADEPPGLAVLLPARGGAGRLARFVAVAGWGWPLLALPLVGGWLGDGVGGAGRVVSFAAIAAVAAAGLAATLQGRPKLGWVYPPIAAAGAGALAWLATGGGT